MIAKDGPASSSLPPVPKNRPVPIADPMAIIWICRELRLLLNPSCSCAKGSEGGDTSCEDDEDAEEDDEDTGNPIHNDAAKGALITMVPATLKDPGAVVQQYR